ncbi:hypothetical protein BJY00DRAFT_289748 [Aspergillus carlsbadensis]|nr:hypothetical protein BJY00DRAFT_289748 [Aspergillus carlsbadensis]
MVHQPSNPSQPPARICRTRVKMYTSCTADEQLSFEKVACHVFDSRSLSRGSRGGARYNARPWGDRAGWPGLRFGQIRDLLKEEKGITSPLFHHTVLCVRAAGALERFGDAERDFTRDFYTIYHYLYLCMPLAMSPVLVFWQAGQQVWWNCSCFLTS